MSGTVVNYGPLTTAFTPPPECSTLLLYDSSSIGGVNGFWGEECDSRTGTPAASCFPEGWSDPLDFDGDNRHLLADFAGFSPGLHCPGGWVSACTVGRGEGDESPMGPLSTLWEGLKSGQTVVGCCPEGYTCNEHMRAGKQCHSTVNVGEVLSGSSITDRSCGMEALTVTFGTDLTDRNLFAPQLNLIIESARGTDEDGDGGGGGGDLSQNAKIAIGITIPIAAIAIGIAVFFFLRRRKRRAPVQQDAVPSEEPAAKPALEGNPGNILSRPTSAAWRKRELEADVSTTTADVTSPPGPQGNDAVHVSR